MQADGGDIELLGVDGNCANVRLTGTCAGCPSATSPVTETALTSVVAPAAPGDARISLDDRIRDLEANLIGWALKVSHGNKSHAAELLQVKRSTLGDRINRCGLGRADAPVHEPHNLATT
jgi:DNA-binding NtrC family response regulator